MCFGVLKAVTLTYCAFNVKILGQRKAFGFEGSENNPLLLKKAAPSGRGRLLGLG